MAQMAVGLGGDDWARRVELRGSMSWRRASIRRFRDMSWIRYEFCGAYDNQFKSVIDLQRISRFQIFWWYV